MKKEKGPRGGEGVFFSFFLEEEEEEEGEEGDEQKPERTGGRRAQDF